MNYSIMRYGFLKFSIQEFKEYKDLIEVSFSKKIKKIERQFDDLKYSYGDNEEMYADAADGLADEYQQISNKFTHHFRVSFLIYAFSFLEHELIRTCEIQSKYAPMLDLSNIYDCRSFLTSQHVDFKNIDLEWDYLLTVKKIRNLFVHQNGTINSFDKNFKELHDFINKNKRFSLKPILISKDQPATDFSILLEKEAIDEVLSNIDDFFKKLLTQELQIIYNLEQNRDLEDIQ